GGSVWALARPKTQIRLLPQELVGRPVEHATIFLRYRGVGLLDEVVGPLHQAPNLDGHRSQDQFACPAVLRSWRMLLHPVPPRVSDQSPPGRGGIGGELWVASFVPSCRIF